MNSKQTRQSVFPLRAGQTLVEILIAIAVGVIFVTAAAVLVSSVLRLNATATHGQIAASLAKGLLDSTRVWIEGNWENLSSTTRGQNFHYYLSTSTSPFALVTGEEFIQVQTSTYMRYFFVEDVYRTPWTELSPNPPIVGAGAVDPSTIRVSVVYSWPQSATRTIAIYLSRNRNISIQQTDWSGGYGQFGPLTSTNRLFATSTDTIDYATSTGSVMLSL